MAKGFQYREIGGFPKLEVGEEYQTATQLVLPGMEGDDTIHSTIKYLGISSHPDFHRFYIEHETVKNYRVRFNNQRMDSVIIVEEFDLYIPENYTYIWANTKDRTCNELLRRIKENEQAKGRDFNFAEQEIDLVKMGKSIVADITGGHFSQLTIADVQAASLFGPGVGESQDWQRYEGSGEISAIIFQVDYYGSLQRVMVTKNAGVVAYSNYYEKDELELIEKVHDLAQKFVH